MDTAAFSAVDRYHQETKHHYERYARSPGTMDWENQPNPFRFYEGTRVVELPLLKKDPEAEYPDLFRRTDHHPHELAVGTIAGFLELSLGLSAWKATGGSRWSLRMNPSSGNLHPTEGHLVLPQLDSAEGAVYHYNPLIHALEQRARLPRALWQKLTTHFGGEGFLLGLSSIFWRESWKYGERAFRYCNHDVGHALAAASFAAKLFGWEATYLNGLSDDAIETVLGLKKTRYAQLEEEHPDLLCLIHPRRQSEVPRTMPASLIAAFAELSFEGTPNVLSKAHVNWEIIYDTAILTRKPSTEPEKYSFRQQDWIAPETCTRSAAEIIRQRRSATAFNREVSIGKAPFLAILDRTLPREHCAPFDAGVIDPATHLLIFVHAVEEFAPGLYFFCRNPQEIHLFKERTASKFRWQPVESGFPLFLLEEGNFRQTARMVSCHQDIAGSGAFSLGMIAEFSNRIADSPFRYRHLFWEAGMIGQSLYLAAEAHGVRGTGIGCFFDDAVHEILGLKGNRYQSLYHFTIGHPVDDPRLTTYPPYYYLDGR